MAVTAKAATSGQFQDKEKPMEVRRSNITAAKSIFSVIFYVY